ncbi:hypothetical protein CIB48_g9377 [Xylaria polymorpha]|nr:hypothetical protein CIB48_g9377 [Xylaria polymorpha]
MAEIPNSDSPGPYTSSSSPQIQSDDLDLFENLPSDVNSTVADTDDEEDDDDTSIDEEVEEEDEEEDEGNDERGDIRDDDQDYYDDDDFEDFDWDMREVDFDGVGFLVDAEDHPRIDDYNDHLALHHVFLHQLEQQLVQDHWGLRPHSPIMDQSHGGAAPRARAQRDQLVQVEVADQTNVAEAGASARGAPPALGGRRRPRPPSPEIIDLTGDDDDDDDVEMSNLAAQPGRPVPSRQSENRRRPRPQTRNAPPPLDGSDGNVGNRRFIVLTSSDDEDEDRPLPSPPPRRNAHNNHDTHPPSPYRKQQQQHQPRYNSTTRKYQPPPVALRPFSQIMQLQNIPFLHFLSNRSIMANRNSIRDDDLVITGERNISNLPNHNSASVHAANPLLELGQIQLDYAAANPFPLMPPIGPARPPAAGAGPPKPVHEPPAPARPGFTRDTGEDVVAICPSCDQELAYDPEGDDEPPSTPAKKPRSKKAMAEHHFWAVKACGHVYCKRCFDNRRSSSRNPVHVSFRHGGEGGKKLLCAVEDCDSEVTTKTAWVGIFM